MHLVLAAAATEAAVACGGAVSSVGDGAGPTSTSPSSEPTTSSPRKKEPVDTSDPNEDDFDAEVHDDASVPDVVTPDVVVYQSCKNGTMDYDPTYCCAPDAGSTSCTYGGSGTNACQLDCQKVCDAVNPGQSYGFDDCYWDTSSGTAKISYLCGACGVGRIALGAESCVRGDTMADRLAMQAYYEAVSVVAFERLAGVLAREGAPRALVHRARRAADDERRHAERFSSLARAQGACVPPVRVAETPSTLLDLALENAAEGQVRETYGALVALHQSHNAETAELREAFAAIADDEIAHASFSWDLARWFDTKLSRAERHEVAAVRERAMQALLATSLSEHDAVDAALGVPAPARARALFDDLFSRLAA